MVKTYFRSTSDLFEGHQEKKHLFALSICRSSQSALLLNIYVFPSNCSLSVCNSQTLALMPFSSEERTPSLSKATVCSLLSRCSMQSLSYTNGLDNSSLQVSRWEESFPRPSAISLIFYPCQVLITSFKSAQQSWGEYSSTGLTKESPSST